jgi:hypothetical protein
MERKMEKNYDTTGQIGPEASQPAHGPWPDTTHSTQADDTRSGVAHRGHRTVATRVAARLPMTRR